MDTDEYGQYGGIMWNLFKILCGTIARYLVSFRTPRQRSRCHEPISTAFWMSNRATCRPTPSEPLSSRCRQLDKLTVLQLEDGPKSLAHIR